MTQKLGYLVDLAGLKFDEGAKTSWIQLMPLGTYDHPDYGKIEITSERVQRFAANANNKVREIDLDIDYDHKMLTTKAAGWIKEVQARNDGLWGLIDWTEEAAQAIKKKEYKYFSPEFVDEWQHPKTKQVYKDVLNGGGITNRPYLKDILPLNLSEYMAEHNNEGSKTVTPEQLKALAKQLGLPDDATGDQIMEAAQTKLSAPADPSEQKKEEPEQKKEEVQEPQLIAASELKSLAEKNPAIKTLMEVVESQGKILADQAKELSEARIEKTLVQLSEQTPKGFALPPVSKEAIKVLLSEPGMSRSLSEKIVNTLTKVVSTGFVQLNELGQSRTDADHGDADAVKKFNEEIAKVQKDRKLDYTTASLAVASEQPQLFADYQAASYAGRE